jgi:hypothetical protein
MAELTWPLKCRICGSVMIFEDPHRMDGQEVIRARCPKNCRGSDITQERRIPSLPQSRKFNWKAEAQKDQHAHNRTQFFVERTLTCGACQETVTGKFHPHAKTCCGECSMKLNKISAHNRWLKLKKEGGRRWKRKKK